MGREQGDAVGARREGEGEVVEGRRISGALLSLEKDV